MRRTTGRSRGYGAVQSAGWFGIPGNRAGLLPVRHSKVDSDSGFSPLDDLYDLTYVRIPTERERQIRRNVNAMPTMLNAVSDRS